MGRDKVGTDWVSVMHEQSGDAVLYLTRCMHSRMSSDYDVTGLKFKGASGDQGEVLAIIQAFDKEGTPVVAFHAAPTFGECLNGVAARLRNGSLKWKVDEYAR